MPTCPNCGSYIPLGNHSCSCGTTIRYVDEEQERRHDEAVKYRTQRHEYLEMLQNENPYEDDFFNELHHNAVSEILIRNMNENVQNVKRNYNAELDHVDVMGSLQYSRSRSQKNTLTPLSRQASACQAHSTG